MKYFFISLLLMSFLSCNNDKKHEYGANNGINYDGTFNLANADNHINFTAYKHTNRSPVLGVFDKVEVYNNGEGNTIREALNGAEFKIPVTGLDSFDVLRNSNIIDYFFSSLKNSLQLKGRINIIDDTTGYVNFHMNEITEKLNFTYIIDDSNTFTMEAVMDTKKWGAQDAIKTLNNACLEVHRGKDGVSKTWSDIKINIISTFKH